MIFQVCTATKTFTMVQFIVQANFFHGDRWFDRAVVDTAACVCTLALQMYR